MKLELPTGTPVAASTVANAIRSTRDSSNQPRKTSCCDPSADIRSQISGSEAA
jgi:hypothetical protein